jgi:hypothetical protein
MSLLGDMLSDEELRKLDVRDWFTRAALHAQRMVRAEVVSCSWRKHPGQGIHSDTMPRYALEHHLFLGKLEGVLATKEILTSVRRQRLALHSRVKRFVKTLSGNPTRI